MAVVVRGGGAKASLDVFDLAMVAHAIATAAVPVWTGIGHTGDRTVADEVAHRCFPTPVGRRAGPGRRGRLGLGRPRAGRRPDRPHGRRPPGHAPPPHLDGHRRAISTLARSQLARHEQTSARTSADLRRSAARGLERRADHLTTAAHAIRVSGGAELRDADRRLASLALDAAGAARRRCVDAGDELAAAAAR